MHVPSLIDKVRISWIPPLVDSISFRSELSFFFLSSLLAAHRSCYFAWGFALLAAGAQKHMSRCHSAQRLRTRGIEWVYLLRAIRRRQRPGAVKCCAQPSVFSQWSNQTNPSDKQLGKINLFFSLAKTSWCVHTRKPVFKVIINLSHGFGEFNNNKKWRQSRCSVWSCCVIKNIHVNTGDRTGKLQVSESDICYMLNADWM